VKFVFSHSTKKQPVLAENFKIQGGQALPAPLSGAHASVSCIKPDL